MKEYLQGRVVVSEVYFRDEQAKIAVDPNPVQFYYQPCDTAPSDTLEWDGETTEPAVGTIARLGVGHYMTYIDTTSFIGVTDEYWDGFGVHQAPGERQFRVLPRGSFTQ